MSNKPYGTNKQPALSQGKRSRKVPRCPPSSRLCHKSEARVLVPSVPARHPLGLVPILSQRGVLFREELSYGAVLFWRASLERSWRSRAAESRLPSGDLRIQSSRIQSRITGRSDSKILIPSEISPA